MAALVMYIYNLKPKVGTVPSIVYYKRVSTRAQAESGYSLQVQEDLATKLEEEGKWRILRIFEDRGKSARDLNRPELEELLDFCDENQNILDAVVVQDTSRLSRNVHDHIEIKTFLQKRAIKMVSLDGNNDETDEGQFVDIIIAGINELESKRTGRKTKRIMKAMFEEGLKPGAAPLGYLNSFQKGIPMKPDDEKKYFIQEAFRLWNTGNHSIKEISDILFDKGLRSKNGKKVHKSALQKCLKDISYAGGLSYDGEVNEKAQHEGIISMTDYRKAQKVFEMRNKGANRSRKYETLLSGIAHCFKCGTLMYGEYHLKGDYYRCRVCGSPYANMKYVDEYVERFFNSSVFTDNGLDRIRKVLVEVKAEQGKSVPKQKESLTKRKIVLDKKMRLIEDKLFSLDGVVDKERLEQRYLPLKEEMKQVEQNLLGLGKSSNNLKDNEIDKIITGLQQLGEIYKVLDMARRKQFIRFFIKKAFVDSKESKVVNFELVPEFEMLLSRDLVRISSDWLPRVDSNHEPAG